MRSLATLALTLAVAARASRAQPLDVVTTDPPVRDTLHRAAFAELALSSGGSRMNGFLLIAEGEGPHPLVVLLHGYPGNERNLDVAQALRRAGTNVLYFDYRGNFGSGGTFSFANAQGDVAAALRWARTADTARTYRIDPNRIALVGHSMGGWLALLGAARDPRIACVAGIEFAEMTEGATDTSFASYTRWLTAPGGPLRGDPRAMLATLAAHAADWKLTAHAAAIATRPVLLLDNDQNPDHDDLVAALRAAKAPRLTELVWATDHAFDDMRVQLSRAIVDWTRSACGF